jgi:SAM-dependent methyltransferase
VTEVDFTQVVELPHHRATPEQLSMCYTRYWFARERARDREVLEVACGGGMGLGYLAAVARRVVGGDIDPKNLAFALETHKQKPNVVAQLLDAHALPFEEASFDLVILFDTIYFLGDARRFVGEAFRVLRPGGLLLVSTVNRNWTEFNPSHQATRYFTASELEALLQSAGFRVRTFAGFPAEKAGGRAAVVNTIRRLAAKWRLIPTNVRAKEMLKRLFVGRLAQFGAEVRDGMAPLEKLVPVDTAVADSGAFKILYFEALK